MFRFAVAGNPDSDGLAKKGGVYDASHFRASRTPSESCAWRTTVVADCVVVGVVAQCAVAGDEAYP